MDPGPSTILIMYINHRGETSTRVITPSGGFTFGATPWHTEPQWLLEAFDHDKGDHRTFAMKDIKAWLPYKPAAKEEAKPAPKETKPPVMHLVEPNSWNTAGITKAACGSTDQGFGLALTHSTLMVNCPQCREIMARGRQ